MPFVAIEETLTIAPLPCSSMTGRTARQPQSAGKSEREISASICRSSKCWKGRIQIAPPTLLTSTSMAPWARCAFSMIWTLPLQVSQSAVIGTATPPSSAMARATASTSGERSTSSSRPPSRAAEIATSLPMPCAAPVTMMLLPAKRGGRPCPLARICPLERLCPLTCRPPKARTSRNGSSRASRPSRSGRAARHPPLAAGRRDRYRRCRHAARRRAGDA